MTKEVIIVILIILVIYLYYQQNNQPNLLGNSEEKIKNLQQEVQHYQTLYQKRVEKDLGGEKIIELKDQKIKDLEKQLLDLAKQKIKGKKEFQELLKQLETN